MKKMYEKGNLIISDLAESFWEQNRNLFAIHAASAEAERGFSIMKKTDSRFPFKTTI